MSLYVLHVQTGNERKIRQALCRKEFTAYVPEEYAILRKEGEWSEIQRVVMPGYVFVSLELTAQTYYEVRSVPGVIRFLGIPPKPIPEREQRFMNWLINSGEVIAPSEGYIENGKVIISSGKLSGMEGQIIRVNRRQKRATIGIDILGERHKLTLSIRFK